MTDQVRLIPLSKIDPNPNQPRKAFPEDHIAQLAASIKEKGLLQPITLRPYGKSDRFMIVAGECRWRAHLKIGAAKIRAIVRDMTVQDMQILAIVENLQRRDMNPIEEARAYKTLLDGGMPVGEIVKTLGLKSTSIIRQRIDLLDLSEDLQHLVSSGNLAVNMAWGVAQAPVHLQTKLLRDIQSGKLRTSEQVKHAGIAMREAAAQMDVFAALPKASTADLAAISRLERKVDQIAGMVSVGFKNGECVAAQRVSPERVEKIILQLTLIRKHVLQMEHDLRAIATQVQIKMEIAA